MSSVLFTRKPKPFDVSGLPSRMLMASKGNASKRPAVHSKSGLSLLLEDDDDRDFVVIDAGSSNEKMITKKCELDDEDDDDDDHDHVRTSRRLVATANRSNSNNTAAVREVKDVADEDSCSGGEDDMLQQCRQLSVRLESQRKKIKSDLSSQAVTSRPTCSVQRSIASAATAVADDYLCSSRVLSAAERLKQKGAFSTAAHDAQNTPAMAISLSAQAAAGQQSSLHHLKLVTRVNGLHEWKWSFAPDKSFLKFKEKFQAIYLVPLHRFKLLIDGEVIDGRQTCNDLGIRSGDVIDVQMDRDVYSEAIKNAASFRELTSAQPAPPDRSAAAEDTSLLSDSAVTDGIKLKTRLNGTHERRWVISRSAPFDQFRQTFSAAYGLPSTAVVKLVFDGDSIPGSATPTSLDMEDDNMIDVKIDKALYEAAVKAANSSGAVCIDH